MIGDTLSSRSADTLSLLRQNQTSPAKADTDSLQLVDLHAVQEVDSGFEGTPISYSPRTDDAIALTLLACFFLSSIALARGKKFLSQQVKDFVLHRERTSIFDSSTAAECVPFSYRDGYHPGMQFHTALMAFVDGKLQGIIARTSARKS